MIFTLFLQNITITIDVTTNHQGWFIHRLCPVKSPSEIVTQKCFDQHVLPIAGTTSDRYYIRQLGRKSLMLDYKITLPKGLTCSQCVLQWTWTSGRPIYKIH